MHELLKLRLRSFTILGSYALRCLIGILDIMIYLWYSVLSKEYILVFFFLTSHGQSSEFFWDFNSVDKFKASFRPWGSRILNPLGNFIANFILVSYVSYREKFRLLIIQMDIQANYEGLRTFCIGCYWIRVTKVNCQRSGIRKKFFLSTF